MAGYDGQGRRDVRLGIEAVVSTADRDEIDAVAAVVDPP